MSKKRTALPLQRTFFVHFFAVVLHGYNVKRQETFWLHVLWRKCRACSSSLFHCRSFFHWWPLAFLFFSPPLQIHVVLPTKVAPYLSLLLSFALFLVELHWPVAYFFFFLRLSLFLYSKFVDITINLSLIL